MAPGETGVWLKSDTAGLWPAGVIGLLGERLSGLGALLRSAILEPARAPAPAAAAPAPAAAAVSGDGVLMRRGAGASARGIEPLVGAGAPALSANGFSKVLVGIGSPAFSSESLWDGCTAAWLPNGFAGLF